MSEKEALDRLLAGYPGEVAETARALRALIHRTLPVAEERVDAADHLIGFAFADPDGGKPAWDVLAVVPHSWHVNVQFGNGWTSRTPAASCTARANAPATRPVGPRQTLNGSSSAT